MRIRRAGAAALLLAFVAVPGRAQFGGRQNDAVVYLLSGRGSISFSVVPANQSNAGITGFQVINPATIASAPISPDFPAKQVQVLHKEKGDLFAYYTQTENIVTSRGLVVAPAKGLTLDGILRDANEGSVSLAPLDLTGGLYVPFIPGVAQGPDWALQTPHILLWTPSDSSPAVVSVPDGTHSQIGPAGATGIEFEALAGAAPYFIPWTNMYRAYPADAWPDGIDVKFVDDDAAVGNSTRFLRLRPAKTTPAFTLSVNTHLFVVQGQGIVITPPGGAPVNVPLGYYAFIPKGYAISVSNPRNFSSANPPNADGN